jgi:hypothetical protein
VRCIEGVCFAFRDSLEALAQAGTSAERVTAIGGGSRRIYWLAGPRDGASTCPSIFPKAATLAQLSVPPGSA